MTVSNVCVGVVVWLLILVTTGAFGWFNMWLGDEEGLFMIFIAWITSAAGFAVFLTIILVQNNLI